MRKSFVACMLMVAITSPAPAQHLDKFRQLEEILPTPNSYRTASGAPGHAYWQQKVDYEIEVSLDEERHWITGSERITYTNNSPDTLTYLWLQLDQNNFAQDSTRRMASSMRPMRRNPVIGNGSLPISGLRSLLEQEEFEGGHRITRVADGDGSLLKHTINGTMMRIDLPAALKSGESFVFEVDWNYPIVDSRMLPARSAREYFEDDDNWVYEIAQWFPRLCVYSDNAGWQNKQFISSEFTLEFGDYTVSITAPADHIVASTGELQNPDEVLTTDQRERLDVARAADAPTYIVTPEEAEANESSEPEGTKTWTFRAENVRDFAWASSRKFIWDAQGVDAGDGNKVMAMSYWPKEAEPLWSQYSTQSIVHTLDVYGAYLFPYPYPVINSVNGSVGGMEYPMMTFNGARPEEDGTYGRYTKYGLISVIIHEVGHTWFPMVVNSDERQWTWMDEGLNTYMQFLAEQAWEEDYPSRRGEPRNLTGYFRDRNKVAIMTEGDALLQVGNNAYGKAAVGLNVLRETIVGRELFDYAFHEYANRWKFKKPEPADLFRTIEDASGMDLDWFWRGWYYSTDHTDIALERVREFKMETGDPDDAAALDRGEWDERPVTRTQQQNEGMPRRVDKHPELFDFYNLEWERFDVSDEDREKYQKMLDELSEEERALLHTSKQFYAADFRNIGGLVMPIILRINYADHTNEIVRIPAEIWRYNNVAVSKLLVTEKTIESIELDPFQETGDTDESNNRFPRLIEKSRFQVKPDEAPSKNPMQEKAEREKKANEDENDDAAEGEADAASE